MAHLVPEDNPVLRLIAEPVALEAILSVPIQKIITDMKNILGGTEHGVAIAAPQIGSSLQIFVVRGSVFDHREHTEEMHADAVFINPRITKRSKKESNKQEGCLSVRGLYGTVSRAEKVTVVAYNERGEKISRGASGFLAQIFQHEIDHLQGILYTDKATEIHKDEHMK